MLLYIIIFLTAFCSIIYELLISNVLGLLTSNYIIWQTLTIGFYIFGLGIGTYIYERFFKYFNAHTIFIKIELLLVYFASCSLIIIYLLKLYFKGSNLELFRDETLVEYVTSKPFYMFLFGFVSQIFTLAISILSGFEIPLLLRFFEKETNGLSKVLSIHHFGTLIATLFFSLYLKSSFSNNQILLLTVFTNLFIITLLIRQVREFKYLYHLIFSLIFVLIMYFVYPIVHNLTLKQHYYSTISLQNGKPIQDHYFSSDFKDKNNIQEIDSLYQKMHLFNFDLPDAQNVFHFYLDFKFQFDSLTENNYHESFVHFPIILTEARPRNVLVLGAGDGLITEELLKYSFIESITQIELDKKMYDLAISHPTFLSLNKNSFSNSKVKVLFQDALYYMRNTKEKFDIIFIDFPYPYTYNLSRLYSVEFYNYVRKHLNPDGFIILDLPLQPDLPDEFIFTNNDRLLNSTVLNTFKSLNFNILFPYHFRGETFLLLSDSKKSLNKVFQNIHNIPLEALNNESFQRIINSKFPHDIDTSLINSIFKPTLFYNMPTDF